MELLSTCYEIDKSEAKIAAALGFGRRMLFHDSFNRSYCNGLSWTEIACRACGTVAHYPITRLLDKKISLR
jgi:hypothetical protein